MDIGQLSTANRLVSRDNRLVSMDNRRMSTDNGPMAMDNGLMSTDNGLVSMDNGLMSMDNWLLYPRASRPQTSFRQGVGLSSPRDTRWPPHMRRAPARSTT